MEKKRFYKVIRAFKHHADIFPFDPMETMCSIAAYIVTFEDKKDTLLCSYRVIAENGIKAIDLAIKEFENDYHHRDLS